MKDRLGGVADADGPPAAPSPTAPARPSILECPGPPPGGRERGACGGRAGPQGAGRGSARSCAVRGVIFHLGRLIFLFPAKIMNSHRYLPGSPERAARRMGLYRVRELSPKCRGINGAPYLCLPDYRSPFRARTQQMRPPSNASFTTAGPRVDGQADSRLRGYSGAPVRGPPVSLPAEGTQVCVPGCVRRV